MNQHMNQIVRFIQCTSYEDIPDKAIKNAKQAFTDTLAVSIAALETENADILHEVFLEYYDNGSMLSVIQRGRKDDAAFVWGALTHILDFDDVNFTFQGHPSVALIPIIMVLGKEKNLTGKQMLLAYAVGFEVQARIGEAIGSEQYNLGNHTTSTVGIFGAIAAACNILRFNELQIKHTFGMASSLAAGSRKNFGTKTKPLHVGFLSRNVYWILKLVEKGIDATDDIFNEPIPIDLLTTGQHLNKQPIKKLGETWELETFGVITKKYPCCAYTHRSIDALFNIQADHEIELDKLEKIEAIVHYKVPAVLIYPKASTALEGKFSMQYCLAAALTDSGVNLDTFTDEMINRENVQKVMRKVQMSIDPAQKAGTNPKEQAATIKVYVNGEVYTSTVCYPKGHPVNPFNDEEMFLKFKSCVQYAYPTDRIQAFYNDLMQIEEMDYQVIAEHINEMN